MLAAVDVRGGGPGTRETDLLDLHNTVERVHAILLCGGSAFGLAAADGAMRELESRGVGFPVFGEASPGPRVPIVPAAVIFDLVVGDPAHRPTSQDGAAVVAARWTGRRRAQRSWNPAVSVRAAGRRRACCAAGSAPPRAARPQVA